ncbi:hemerythrin domain-containing protein [Paucibacter soli]|uniref:hemerythrin domain-containing protein n=1 Tax=Paucibacter soli TaxID=3133433 RepID=UPI0030ABE904
MTIIKHKPATKASASGHDAIAMLKADHAAVERLFADYGKASTVSSKQALVAALCKALSVHAQLEEEIFYPAVKAALKDKLLVPEATVEHAGVENLLAQLQGQTPNGELYDAKVKVLSEYVKHHIKEEQSEMFAKAAAAKLDLAELGTRMATRKAELLAALA